MVQKINTVYHSDLKQFLYSLPPFGGMTDPVFVIGCGRSGTTIFGRSLSRNPEIAYLNEPRHLWLSGYKNTDIWSENARKYKGKLFFDETDVSTLKSYRLRRLFQYELQRNNSRFLVEKLPINNFRLRFIHNIFPNARFIHIYRNGIEVAKSIEKLSNKGGWYGVDMYKWKKLVEYDKGLEQPTTLSDLCDDNYKKALLEWNLSIDAITKFLASIPTSRYIEISYDAFLDSPSRVLDTSFHFIGTEHDSSSINFTNDLIQRRSEKYSGHDLSEVDLLIGGPHLEESFNPDGGLTKRDR